MTSPVRLQLSRRKGFDLQALSRATNGLPAVVVARPSKWGNPYRVGTRMTAAEAVEAFRELWNLMVSGSPARRELAAQELADLRGKNLACWCNPGEPCHADVLLKLANRQETVDGRRPDRDHRR